MKQKITRLGLLCLLAFILSNCQKDDLHEDIETSKKNDYKSTPNIQELSFKELKRNQAAFNIVSQITNSRSSLSARGGVYSPSFRMELDTTKIIKIEQDSSRYSLTFRMIEESPSQNITRNLVLDAVAPDIFYAFIYEYNLPERERNQLASGSLNNIKGYLDIITINPDFSQNRIQGISSDCWEEILISEAQACASGNHSHAMGNASQCKLKGDALPQEAETMLILKADCDFGGGSSGPSPYGPGGDEGTQDPWANPDLGGIGSNGENNNTYPGNPGEDDNENEEPVSSLTTIPLFEYIPKEEKDPCDKISNLLDETKNPGVKDKLIELIGKTSDSTEAGAGKIVGSNNGTNDGITDYTYSGDGYLDIDPPSSGKFSFIGHTHNSPANSTYSVFSWWDLSDGLYSWIKNNQITNNFVYFVFTADGTYYAITVENASNFKKFFTPLDDLLDNPSPIQISTHANMNNALTVYFKGTKDKEPLIKEDNTDYTQDAKYFLQMLKDANIGIEVFETDNSLSSFDKVSLDENGNKKEENCN